MYVSTSAKKGCRVYVLAMFFYPRVGTTSTLPEGPGPAPSVPQTALEGSDARAQCIRG
jgi:hypothetical protein